MKKNCLKYQRLMNDSIQNKPNQRSTGGRNERRDNGKKNNTANRTGISRKAGEAGIFVEAIMNGFRVKLLVDTGATLSIISPDVLHAVLNDPSPIFDQVDKPILMADRTALKVEGSVLMSLSISGQEFRQIEVCSG